MLTDIRYALRTMLRDPGFAATAALTLAIGIGANTAIFTVVYALLLKPLPFHDADRLIYVHDTFPAVANASVSMPKFVALRDGNRSLSSLAATSPSSLTMTGIGDPHCSRHCWRRSGSTASLPIRSRAARARSASASRSARSPRRFCASSPERA